VAENIAKILKPRGVSVVKAALKTLQNSTKKLFNTNAQKAEFVKNDKQISDLSEKNTPLRKCIIGEIKKSHKALYGR
jgi:hypothetical protein